MSEISKIKLPDGNEYDLKDIAARGKNAYGTCTTAATLQIKKVTILESSWKLITGCIIGVKFTNTNTYSAKASAPCQLNVNLTGAKNIYYNNTATPTGTNTTAFGYANRYGFYMYDGTYWVWLNQSVDNNSTYSNASLGQGYGTCTTAAATVAKVVTLSSYALTTGGVVSVKFDYDVPASATMNINSKGAKAIYHRGAAITSNVIRAGDIATFMYDGTQYHLLAIDRLSMPTSFSTTVGDGTETDFTIAHNLNTKNIITSVVINGSYIAPLTGLQTINQIGYQIIFVDNNSFTIKFTDAPASNGATINVININTMTPQDGSYLIV